MEFKNRIKKLRKDLISYGMIPLEKEDEEDE